MLNDCRYAFRALRQNRGFALTAIVSIALAIGANSAIFSISDGLLLRPLSLPGASQVATIRAQAPNGNLSHVSYADYIDFRDHNKSFDGVVAYGVASAGFAKDKNTQPQLKIGFLVTGNFFPVLQVQPQIGRGFRPDEDTAGNGAVVVLSYDLWKSEFAADPSVVGASVLLNGVKYSVVGVAPESFAIDHFIKPAFYVPIAMAPVWSAGNRDFLTNRSRREVVIKGRLKPGVTIAAAGADIAAIAKSNEESYPLTNRSYGAVVRSERQFRMEFDPSAAALTSSLLALVAIVLAIACANVANLMLTRGRTRTREVAVRLAIGAGRFRLVRQLMVESLMIAFAGAALGLLIAEYAVEAFSTVQIPGDLPIQLRFHLDLRVLAFTLLVSIASAVLFGLLPALQATKSDLVSGLKSGESEHAHGRMIGRRALVVVQLAGSLVLMIVTAQLYGGIERALFSNHGFRTDHRITMRFAPESTGYTPEKTQQFYKTLVDSARGLPGIQSAAISAALPMTTNLIAQNVIPEGFTFPAGQNAQRVFCDFVGDGYFETFAIPILAGRGFSPEDRADAPAVAVVNDEFAKRFFKGDALGKRIKIDAAGDWLHIAGVTVTGQHFSVFEPPVPWMYLPAQQHPQQRMTLIAETSGDAASFATPLRQMVHSIDPNVPIFAVQTMDDLFNERSIKVAHLLVGVVGALGGMGLVLALVGLYAVVAYQVSRKTREIGIRVAIGAARVQVVSMILKHAGSMAGAGVAIGMALGIALRQILSGNGQILPVFVLSPATLVLLGLSFFGTTLLAAAIPARRAAQIDPMKALRQE